MDSVICPFIIDTEASLLVLDRGYCTIPAVEFSTLNSAEDYLRGLAKTIVCVDYTKEDCVCRYNFLELAKDITLITFMVGEESGYEIMLASVPSTMEYVSLEMKRQGASFTPVKDEDS